MQAIGCCHIITGIIIFVNKNNLWLWFFFLDSDGQQSHQQNKQPSLTSNHWTQKKTTTCANGTGKNMCWNL